MPSNYYSKKNLPATAGFGLVELLVTMTIMALVSTVVLVNDNSFKGTVVMRNQAYEIAFMLRQAQLLAVGATDDTTTANQRFGVRVDSTDSSITLFSDSTNPVGFNAGDLVLDRRVLDRRFVFDDITIDPNGTPLADNALVDIIFERPNFNAVVLDSAGDVQSGAVHITLGAAGGALTRQIEVLNSGSISVLSN